MEAHAGSEDDRRLERAWWLRTLALFTSPGAAFRALRDPDPAEASAREEPVLALILLAGVTQFLAMPDVDRLFNLRDPDALVIAVVVFLAGALYGLATYWVGGGALRLGIRAAGGAGDYRLARHMLAFATAPLALAAITLWPVRFAVEGTALVEADEDVGGSAHVVFEVVEAAVFVWGAVLLVVGVRAVYGWPILRALGALALTLLALVAFGLIFALL